MPTYQDPLRAANNMVGMRIAAATDRKVDGDDNTAKKIVPMPHQDADPDYFNLEDDDE